MQSVPNMPEKVCITSFKSDKDVQTIRTSLEEAFQVLSIQFNQSDQHKLWYDCSNSQMEFITRIYKSDDQHIVEFHHDCGCRYSYSQVALDLSNHLKVTFIGGKYHAIPFCPPELP